MIRSGGISIGRALLEAFGRLRFGEGSRPREPYVYVVGMQLHRQAKDTVREDANPPNKRAIAIRRAPRPRGPYGDGELMPLHLMGE